MKLFLFSLLAICVSSLAVEPSVYGAGDLNSANPYGLTSSEERILQNKEKVTTLDKSVGNVKIELSRIRENYEGLRSVTESIGSKIAKIDGKTGQLDEKTSANRDSFIVLSQDFADLKTYVAQSRELQDKNQENIKTVLSELGSLIDSINTNYISKDKFAQLASSVAKLEEQIGQSSIDQQKDTLGTKSGSALLEEATALFDKKSYNEAKARFDILVEKNYKPARSNFYLGEIAYATKSYKTAILHYKKSISLYDKADYMPQLLYHTGVSFTKLKDSAQARNFFDALKTGYPDSPEAKSIK